MPVISRRSFANWAVLLLVCTLGAGMQVQAEQGPPPKYVLQWSDNFHDGVLDITKWNYRTDIKAKSAQLPANVSVDSLGHLNIALRQQDFAGQRFTGGGIVSKAFFRYGYFQVRAKTTTNPGWHSSFWMFAGNGATTYTPGAYTEIDDFEINSAMPEVISMGRLEWAKGRMVASTRCNAHYKPGYSTAGAYHTYGLQWTEQEITYYLDGSKICSQPYPPEQYRHDPLNIWLTAIGYSSGIAVGKTPSPVSFANVAFYIRDYYIADQEPGYVEYGTGWEDRPLPGYSSIPSRVSCRAGASATYTPTILEAGNYDVEVYRNADGDSDPAARLTVFYAGGKSEKTINFKAGANGWVDLGTYPFAVGSGGSLNNANSGVGCTHAGMVKFVRQ